MRTPGGSDLSVSFGNVHMCRINRGHGTGKIVNYGALLRSASIALLRNKLRSALTVLGITIGIGAVICVVAIGKAGQAVLSG